MDLPTHAPSRPEVKRTSKRGVSSDDPNRGPKWTTGGTLSFTEARETSAVASPVWSSRPGAATEPRTLVTRRNYLSPPTVTLTPDTTIGTGYDTDRPLDRPDDPSSETRTATRLVLPDQTVPGTGFVESGLLPPSRPTSLTRVQVRNWLPTSTKVDEGPS